MNYIKDALTQVRQRHHVQNVVSELVRVRCSRADLLADVVTYADEYAELILRMLRAHMLYTTPEAAYGALLLLERLVSACSYVFHLALARYWPLHERLLALAVRRAEGSVHRSAQRLARLTLLEYSRMFADNAELAPLARLAGVFEQRTHRSLMRCLNMQLRRVRFREPGMGDVVQLSDGDDGEEASSRVSSSGSSSSGSYSNSNQSSSGSYSDKGGDGNSSSHHRRASGGSDGGGKTTSTSTTSHSGRGTLVASSSLALPSYLSSATAAAEVWPCRTCGYLNSPFARRCAACESTRCAAVADGASSAVAHAAGAQTTTAAAVAAVHDNKDDDEEGVDGKCGSVVRSNTSPCVCSVAHNGDACDRCCCCSSGGGGGACCPCAQPRTQHEQQPQQQLCNDDDNDHLCSGDDGAKSEGGLVPHSKAVRPLLGRVAQQHDARLADVQPEEELCARDDVALSQHVVDTAECDGDGDEDVKQVVAATNAAALHVSHTPTSNGANATRTATHVDASPHDPLFT